LKISSVSESTTTAIVSDGSFQILNVNDLPTGSISIQGESVVGEELNVDLSNISDLDGIENAVFSYQWYYDEKLINGATNNNLVIENEFAGSQITVRIAFNDDQGTTETLTSEPTDTITSDVKTVIIPAYYHHTKNSETSVQYEVELSIDFTAETMLRYDYSPEQIAAQLASLTLNGVSLFYEGEKIPVSFFEDTSDNLFNIIRTSYEDGTFADSAYLQLQGVLPSFELTYSTFGICARV